MYRCKISTRFSAAFISLAACRRRPSRRATIGICKFYFSTFTPFQNATYPLICFAAGLGSG